MKERRRRPDFRLLACAVLASSLQSCRLNPSDDRLEPSYTPLWLISGETRTLGLAPGGRLVAVELASGTQAWDFELSTAQNPLGARHQGVVCTPVLMGGSILVREEEEMVVLDMRTGKVTYSERLEPATRFGSRVCPTRLDEETYAVTLEGGRRVRRARPDGVGVWSTDLPNQEIAVGPVRKLAGNDIAVRTKSRLVVWTSDGRLRWAGPLGDYTE